MNIKKDEPSAKDEPSVYEFANKFIELANDLVKTDNTGTVGAALRYAAARYSVFEASLRTDDLAEEKEKTVELHSDEYRKMLVINIDDYIKRIESDVN